MDVSVIIVNYNTKELTKNCIDSIFAQTSELDFEVILVDNGSTDGSKEHFVKDKRISYIYSEENLGFGRANNWGLKYASGRYIFFLNSDTYLVNNAIFILWKVFRDENESSSNVSCAGCMLTDKNGSIIHSYAKFPSMFRFLLGASIYPILWKLHFIPELPSTSNYNYECYKEKEIIDVDYITGADLMVRRDVIEQIGLFDADFFMYSEETEMEYRYMKAGFRRIICKGPLIVHLEGKSNMRHSPKRKTMVLRSNLLFFKKTSSRLSYFIFLFVYKLLYVLTHIFLFPFINGKTLEKLEHLYEVIRM